MRCASKAPAGRRRGDLEHPAGAGLPTLGDASFFGGYSGCPTTAGYKVIAMTGLAQAWSGRAGSTDTLGMVAANEADDNQWKRPL